MVLYVKKNTNKPFAYAGHQRLPERMGAKSDQ